MWQIIQKPKHNLAHNPRGLGWLMAFLGPSMPFDFVLDKPVEECAESLEAQERINIWRKLYGNHTEVDVDPDSPAIYEFCIRTHTGHRFSPMARGYLIRVARDKTLISGRVRDFGRFMILFALLVITLAHVVALLMPISAFLIGVLLLATASYYVARVRLIGFLKETLRQSRGIHSAQRKSRAA